MDFFEEYLAKVKSTCKSRQIDYLLDRECEPADDTNPSLIPILKDEQKVIADCFSNNDNTAVSGDTVEKTRCRKFGRKRHKTADIYFFTGMDDDPIRVIECKYRKGLPMDPGKDLKEIDLFDDAAKKIRISRTFLRHYGRRCSKFFLVCNAMVAEILKSDYIDYCAERSKQPLFRIIDTLTLKEAI